MKMFTIYNTFNKYTYAVSPGAITEDIKIVP